VNVEIGKLQHPHARGKVAAAHNNNTYRDRLYLKNTATKAKEFQLSTAGLLFQTFINSLFCRTVLLSIECFGIRHELPQKRTINKFLDSQQQYS